ncbi:hypothetical protein FE773_03750 [Caminibacter mediatlanticus TB-2]|uniref:Uncharacterized protein n=1 Tax=Caminibacter mediatlanticus TB-2 TaxID=391592 RepID=A0ABX5V7W9_9BACT|nr:hypothetical protein [Caminibacter mediatlanticus]QCT94321.1 hypothetical protein FE773_03750 [Caminibacter mediatlanticus TB-2]
MYYNKVTLFKIGDLLAIIGAICFGLYSFLVGKIHKKFDGILIIRKTLFWGYFYYLSILYFINIIPYYFLYKL